LRHRVVPSFQALAEEVTADMILDRLIASTPMPRVATDSLMVRAEAAERGALARRPSTPFAPEPGFAPQAPAAPHAQLSYTQIPPDPSAGAGQAPLAPQAPQAPAAPQEPTDPFDRADRVSA